jgi:pimeloyl-ACP methyl ester carboxylesterase
VSQIALLAPSGYPDGLHYPGLYGRLLAPGWPRQLALRFAQTRLYGWLFPRSKARQALSVTNSYGEPWMRMLEQIRAPALIVWSQGDATVRPATAEQIHSKINDSVLLWVDEYAGHSIPTNRPHIAATIACGLARGESPAVVAATLRKHDQQAPFY